MLPGRLLPALKQLRFRGAQCPLSRSKVTNAATEADDRNRVKPYSEIPGTQNISRWGRIRMMWTFMFDPSARLLLAQKAYREYGPIYKQKFGAFELVSIADVVGAQQLLGQEGRYPQRIPIPLTQAEREKGNDAKSLFLSEGEEWLRQRRVVNQHMMKIRTVESHTDDFSKVADDFLQRLLTVRSPDSLAVPQLDNELFNWSVESACTFLLEQRLGCLSEARNPRAQEVINVQQEISSSMAKLFMYPPEFAKIFFPLKWRKLSRNRATLENYVREYMEDRIQQLRERPTPQGETVGFLEYLLHHPDMNHEKVLRNLTEFMQASFDTTSNTFLFIVYELARHPEVQQKLYEEVTKVVPPGSDLKASDLQNVPYLKAVIKETMRLYPIAEAITRILPEESVILGYQIPKGAGVIASLYVMGRMESIYTEAETFRPERWLRDGTSPRSTDDKAKAIAHLPFGFGPRMCVGRRIAELEIQILLLKMVSRFRLEPVVPQPGLMPMKPKMLLVPKLPVEVRFFDR